MKNKALLLMVSNRDSKIRVVTYLFIGGLVLIGVFYSARAMVVPHFLFKVALFASLIAAAFMDVKFLAGPKEEPPLIEEAKDAPEAESEDIAPNDSSAL